MIHSTLRTSPSDLSEPQTLDEIQTQNPPEVDVPESYTAILWNDESHSFNEVIDQVCAAIHCDESHAQNVANSVDQYVYIIKFRAVLFFLYLLQSMSYSV